MEEKKDILSSNIKDWQFTDKLVVFEDYESTLHREDDEKEDIQNIFDDESDLPIKLKDLSFYQAQFQPNLHPEILQPNKHFKLWTLYTKIPLTPKILIMIENIEGIESLDVISRYRARIGIAPLFKDGIVMKTIENIINLSNKNKEIEDIKE